MSRQNPYKFTYIKIVNRQPKNCDFFTFYKNNIKNILKIYTK